MPGRLILDAASISSRRSELPSAAGRRSKAALGVRCPYRVYPRAVFTRADGGEGKCAWEERAGRALSGYLSTVYGRQHESPAPECLERQRLAVVGALGGISGRTLSPQSQQLPRRSLPPRHLPRSSARSPASTAAGLGVCFLLEGRAAAARAGGWLAPEGAGVSP